VVVQVWGLAMITWAALTGRVEGVPLLALLGIAAGLTQVPAFASARKVKAIYKEPGT
jgi:hypothetical protein